MSTMRLAMMVTALVMLLASTGHAQSSRSGNTGFEPVQRLGRDLKPIIKESARNEIKSTTGKTLDRPATYTSTDRKTPPSAAHDRGAVDIRSGNVSSTKRHEEARAISRNLGKDFTVVVEETNKPRQGQQTNSTYRNGAQGNVRVGSQKADGTHTHIQPDFGIGYKKDLR